MTGTIYEIDRRVFVLPGFLTADECTKIIEANRDDDAAPVYPPHGGIVQGHAIEDFTRLCGVEDRLDLAMHTLTQAAGWDIPLDIARYGCSEYRVGQWMAEHVDDEERAATGWDLPHRGISFSIPLSDPDTYEGGQLWIRGAGGRWHPAAPGGAGAGDLIAFGSSLPHRVGKVTAGERWVLLAWGYCNHDRRGIA